MLVFGFRIWLRLCCLASWWIRRKTWGCQRCTALCESRTSSATDYWLLLVQQIPSVCPETAMLWGTSATLWINRYETMKLRWNQLTKDGRRQAETGTNEKPQVHQAVGQSPPVLPEMMLLQTLEKLVMWCTNIKNHPHPFLPKETHPTRYFLSNHSNGPRPPPRSNYYLGIFPQSLTRQSPHLSSKAGRNRNSERFQGGQQNKQLSPKVIFCKMQKCNNLQTTTNNSWIFTGGFEGSAFWRRGKCLKPPNRLLLQPLAGCFWST